jgi:hypothetical protein
MDICKSCSLAWFDGGELALMQLAYQSQGKFKNSKDLQRRLAELEADPERKALFEAKLAKMPRHEGPFEEAFDELFTAVLLASTFHKSL